VLVPPLPAGFAQKLRQSLQKLLLPLRQPLQGIRPLLIYALHRGKRVQKPRDLIRREDIRVFLRNAGKRLLKLQSLLPREFRTAAQAFRHREPAVLERREHLPARPAEQPGVLIIAGKRGFVVLVKRELQRLGTAEHQPAYLLAAQAKSGFPDLPEFVEEPRVERADIAEYPVPAVEDKLAQTVLTEQRAAVAGSQREGRLLPAVYRGAEPLAELPRDFRKALHGGFVDVDFPAYAAVVGAFIAGAQEFIVKLWSHHSFVTSK